ncbi:uncharacterized protein [Chanodichthys erythropterus]|uniref:uncharacterized protein n=1 Tax=Chanodichthys erythropterus TaxID=933992 RepID=UPI00351F3E83
MEFMKEENEEMKIVEVFSLKQEDNEEQTKMEFIKEESEDMNSEVIGVKIEDTEEQTNMEFIKEESGNLRIEEVFSVNQGDTETQKNMAVIKKVSEDKKTEEAFSVKHDTEEQTECPLCLRGYHQLSQHLRVSHKVINSQERKLLLAISSGRVDVRKGTCPVPGCSKYTTRIDRHLKGHSELTREAQQETIQVLKRKKIIHDLAELRASNPAVPMASTLDQEEAQDLEDAALSPEEEEGTCDNPCCQQASKRLQDQVVNLKRRVKTLKSVIRVMTRRNSLLRRRSRSIPSTQVAQVTSKHLMALRSPEKEVEKEEGKLHTKPSGKLGSQGLPNKPPITQPSSQQCEEYPFPDHVVALNVLLEEYWGHHDGANLTPKVKNNVASKVFHIRQFIAYMAAGRSDLASLTFLNQTNRMGSWLNSLTEAKINKTTIHQYLKNIVHFLDYLAETPPPTCQLSKLVLVGIRREARAMLKLFWRKEVVPGAAFKQAKDDNLIPKAMLKECLSCAKRMIPEILACLRKSGDKKNQWSFYGHLTAYLACLYGHRGAVFQNMTIKEVEEAQQTAREGTYVITISAHKTNQAFGAAQLAMDAQEYEWLEEFLSMRSILVGGKDAHYFFFTSKPSICKNLNQYFQEAWAGMGLPGTPTFTDVRNSIATHAKNTHCPDDWYKVAKFMCYDTSTADRFYALNLNAKQTAEHRRLFEIVVRGEETTPVKKVETRKRPITSRQKRACKRAARLSSLQT